VPGDNKGLVFVTSSQEAISSFPLDAKREAGHRLRLVQEGHDPSDWKWVPTVGAGVREIRVSVGDEYRVFYVTNIGRAVYVLHAFAKKTRKTSQADINIGRRRLNELKQCLRQPQQSTRKGKKLKWFRR
jgi:phage-related protein